MKIKRILSIALVLAMLLGIAAVGGVFSLEAQAEEPICAVGDTFTLGSYPQSRVTADIAENLNGIPKTWKSYRYYSGDDDHSYESTTEGDWMEYADVTYEGNKYRAVRLEKLRPKATHLPNHYEWSTQYDNDYRTNYIYWFKYEPITWRVLDPSTGLVISDLCLDAQEFSVILSTYTFYPDIDESSVTRYFNNDGFANRYEYDDSIRSWLNLGGDSFWSTAFSSSEKNRVSLSDVYDLTKDYIFLLSEDDATKSSYGLSSDASRKARCTEYAAAQGCEISSSGYSPWWTLTYAYSFRGYDTGMYVRAIGSDGIAYDKYANATNCGVRPAMRVNLSRIFINDVSLHDVAVPVAGAMSHFDYNIITGADYVKDTPRYAAWIETDTKPTSFSDLNSGTYYWVNQNDFFFKANKYYTFRADIRASSGHAFSSLLTARINGIITANIKPNGSYYSIWHCFGKCAPPITSVNITGVSVPVGQEKPSFGYLIPIDAGYTRSFQAPTVWIETDTQPTTYSDLSSGTLYSEDQLNITFNPNKYYTLRVNITAKSGYTFSSSFTAKMNGNTAKVEPQGSYYSIWYCFGKAAKAITSIDITGVTAPVVGATAKFDYNLPSDANYVKDTPSHAVWIETDTRPYSVDDLSAGNYYWVTGSGFTFKANKYYTFRADIRAKSGYAFSRYSLGAKINGNQSQLERQDNFYTLWYCFGKPAAESVKALSSISVTTQPTKKTYTAGESFNKAGMVVKANYSDGTSANITSYTVTNGSNLPAGRTSVTISYTEGGVTKTTTVPITVISNIFIPTVAIKNNPGTRTINYGDGIEFTAVVTDMPAGARIKWYVNGAEKGAGTTFTFSDAQADATITVKIVDGSGNALTDAGGSEISASEKITVKAGFFQKLISFFKNLFRIGRITVQKIY